MFFNDKMLTNCIFFYDFCDENRILEISLNTNIPYKQWNFF